MTSLFCFDSLKKKTFAQSELLKLVSEIFTLALQSFAQVQLQFRKVKLFYFQFYEARTLLLRVVGDLKSVTVSINPIMLLNWKSGKILD